MPLEWMSSAYLKKRLVIMKPHKTEILPEYSAALFIPKSKAVEWPDDFWIITACDPYSAGERTVDDQAMKQLRQELCFGVRCFIVTFLPVPPYARISLIFILSNPHLFNRLRYIRHPESDGLAHFEVGDQAGHQDEFGENHRFCIFRRDTIPLWFGKFAAPRQNSPRVNQSGE